DPRIGHAQPDRAPRRMPEATRGFLGRRQDEGVGPRGDFLQEAELAVVDLGIDGQLRQVGTHQGEQVPVPEVAQRPQAIDRCLVPQPAGQHVAGVGGHREQLARAQHLGGLAQQAGLGIDGMDLVADRHAISQSCQIGTTESGSGGTRPSSTWLSPGPWKSEPRDASRPNSVATRAYSAYWGTEWLPLTTSMPTPPASRKSPIMAWRSTD